MRDTAKRTVAKIVDTEESRAVEIDEGSICGSNAQRETV